MSEIVCFRGLQVDTITLCWAEMMCGAIARQQIAAFILLLFFFKLPAASIEANYAIAQNGT